jgi:hypothetical protein
MVRQFKEECELALRTRALHRNSWLMGCAMQKTPFKLKVSSTLAIRGTDLWRWPHIKLLLVGNIHDGPQVAGSGIRRSANCGLHTTA